MHKKHFIIAISPASSVALLRLMAVDAMRRPALFFRTLLVWSLLLLCSAVNAQQIKIGVFLPFKSTSPLGQMSVEYYRGLLMAVDSLSNGGATFAITAADCGNTAAEMEALLNETSNGTFDIIFAPSNQEQIKVVDTYSRRNGTKVCLPLGGRYDDYVLNPSFYALRVTQTDMSERAYRLMVAALPARSIYLVSVNGGKEICPFANYLKKTINGVKTLEWPSKEKKIVQLLSDNHAILVPTMYDDATKDIMKSLAAKSKSVKAAVIGYPAWYDNAIDEASRKELADMNAYVMHQSFARTELPRVKKFAQQYLYNFDKELPNDRFSYAMWGFDSGYYLLKGLIRYRVEFYDQQLYAAPLQSAFHFQPRTTLSGLINTAVLLLHYKADGTQELIELND